MKHLLFDSVSYKRRVARDCLFSIPKYDKNISKNTMKAEVEREEKHIQISNTRLELMKLILECIAYDMGRGRMCEDEALLFYRYLDGTVVPPI